jgi:hypothetical protein
MVTGYKVIHGYTILVMIRRYVQSWLQDTLSHEYNIIQYHASSQALF